MLIDERRGIKHHRKWTANWDRIKPCVTLEICKEGKQGKMKNKRFRISLDNRFPSQNVLIDIHGPYSVWSHTIWFIWYYKLKWLRREKLVSLFEKPIDDEVSGGCICRGCCASDWRTILIGDRVLLRRSGTKAIFPGTEEGRALSFGDVLLSLRG